MATSRHGDFALYRRLLAQVRAYWPHLTGILLLSFLSAPLSLLTPLPLKIAVDSVSGRTRGRTTFIIAHRLSTLKHCVILIRIENGRALSAGAAGIVAEKASAVLDTVTYGRRTSAQDRTQ